MSLVHEALQKAEREKQRKLGTAASAPTSHTSPPPAPTPVVHAPVPVAPSLTVSHGTPATKFVPPREEPSHAKNFLLPSLIGCVAIVAIIAIVFLASNANSVSRQSKENAPAVAAVALPPVTRPASPVESQSAAATPAPAEAVAAPIVTPPVAPVINDSSYKLSGIMKDPDGKPVAVVNGHVLYEGYTVEGATVKKIDTDHVTLDVRGHDLVLRLF